MQESIAHIRNTVLPLSTLQEMYTSGLYLQKHPHWHVEESPWKAAQVLRMLQQNRLAPKTICEIGCGAGEILLQLQHQMEHDRQFWGYDISPQAVALAKTRENLRLHIQLQDGPQDPDAHFDLLLFMDVLEHIEDHFGFLRSMRAKADYKIFHVSLTLSVQTILRKRGLLKVRENYGMVNHFSKETLLQTLSDAGYEIVDSFYTTACTDLPSQELQRNLLKIPRKFLFALHQDLAVRLLGGYRFLVLAR